MKALIIEDELIAVRNLERLILDYDKDIILEEALPSVVKAVARLSLSDRPDLIFMDIQLADGLCFEIFNSIDLDVPVIFTTAFDEYAINAFEAYCVDYLLKPIGPDNFAKSMRKFYKLYQDKDAAISLDQINHLIQNYHSRLANTKKRFLVRSGKKYKSLPIEDIAYFYKEDITYLFCWDGSRYIVDEALSDLESKLPTTDFFRLNRQYVAHINSIDEIIAYSRSRLKVKLKTKEPAEIFVSQATASSLKKWLDQ